MTALAIICALNEKDIIGWTVRHLIRQGCEVLVIDCQSTDGTARIAAEAGAALEGYSAPPVSWHALLGRVEQIAASSSADWIVHCDADEIRYSDQGCCETLVGGFARVDAAGYNAIDHTVFTFHPTICTGCVNGAPQPHANNGTQWFDRFHGTRDPELYFRYYSGDVLNQRLGQVKVWKNVGPVSLAHSGGHQADFPGRRVYPGKFLSKHYPIRSQAHGERKVFQERQWLDQQQGRRDWHVQYEGIQPGHSFLKDPATLQEWK